jgi:hypothetical protein
MQGFFDQSPLQARPCPPFTFLHKKLLAFLFVQPESIVGVILCPK